MYQFLLIKRCQLHLLFLSRADKRPLLSIGWDNGEPCLPGSGGALCLEFQEIGEHGTIDAQSFPPGTFWYEIVAGIQAFWVLQSLLLVTRNKTSLSCISVKYSFPGYHSSEKESIVNALHRAIVYYWPMLMELKSMF